MSSIDCYSLISRDVCKSLRTCVDRFGLGVDEIEIFFEDENVTLKWENDDIYYSGALKDGTIVFHAEGGSNIRFKEKYIGEILFTGLKIFLMHVSVLTIHDYSKYFIESFIEIFKSERIIKVKEIVFPRVLFKDALVILPYFDAETLEKIDLRTNDSINQFEQITHLSQWKNSKSLNFPCNIDSKEISHMFHFENFTIGIDDFNTQLAMKMRDDLMRRSTFKSCCIYVDRWNPIELAKVFKPDYVGGNKFEIKYKNNNYNFTIKSTIWEGMVSLYMFEVIKL